MPIMTPVPQQSPVTRPDQPTGVGRWEEDRYCEGDVCVKHPNCFGANGADDAKCTNCTKAQEAYRQRGWAWLGTQPDVALFCTKWPS
jgi:hypothetical protein